MSEDKPISENEQARRLTIQQGEELKAFVNDQRYPVFVKFFDIAIQNRIELWKSAAGEVDSYVKQLRAEINLLEEIKNAPLVVIQAGENAKQDTGAVT